MEGYSPKTIMYILTTDTFQQLPISHRFFHKRFPLFAANNLLIISSISPPMLERIEAPVLGGFSSLALKSKEKFKRLSKSTGVRVKIHLALKAGKHRGIQTVCASGASRFARRAKPTANPKVRCTSRSRAA